MADLIDRQAAIKALEKYYCPTEENIPLQLVAVFVGSAAVLKDLPSQEKRAKGEWETAYLDHENMGTRPRVLYCSECNQCIAYPTNYCPNCGADMRGDADEIN